MNIVLTTLSENTAARPGLIAEWGLSFHIQVNETKIIFDTGGSGVAATNARRLNIDLSSTSAIVLSHGHTDHTGGLREVLKESGPKAVLCHPSVWQSKYTKRPNEDVEAYIGIPFVKEELAHHGAIFQYARDPIKIADNIMTTGEVPMITDYEKIEPNLLIKNQEGYCTDPFEDDLSLVIRTKKGLVVVLGCAHRGIINHIRHAQSITGEERLYAVVGGTHLGPASRDRLEKTIGDLRKLDVQKIGVSHCTGFVAASHLAKAFEGRFFVNNAGTCLKL